MVLIVCLDLNNGMYFNNRRQSRDREVIKDIAFITKNNNLIMTEYSHKLYRWDKVYPSDYCLNLEGYHLTSTLEFKGYSHEKIVKEVYLRNEE